MGLIEVYKNFENAKPNWLLKANHYITISLLSMIKQEQIILFLFLIATAL